jgi:hypothetical protein
MQAKKILKTLVFYISFGLIATILEKQSPSGPCTPGLGVLAFLLLIPISLGLCIYNFVRAKQNDRSNLPSAIIHLVFFLALLVQVGL